MESRAAGHFSGAHSDEVDYVAWDPTHPDLFCTSSQKDRRIVFWDARRNVFRCRARLSSVMLCFTESRHVQQIHLRVSPVQTNYSPDGKSLLYTSAGHQLFFLTLGKDSESTKEIWKTSDKDGVHIFSLSSLTCSSVRQSIVASTAMFNHAGDGIILTHHSEHTLRIMDYPSLTLRESPAAHVGGCVAVALDPRGR